MVEPNRSQNFPLLKPPKEQIAEGVKVKFPDILQSSFIYLLVGRPGSGKSHLISELVTNPDLYKGCFHRVLFVTPSRLGEIALDDEIRSHVFDIGWLHNKFNEIARDFQDRDVKKSGKANVLVVLDDCIGDVSKLVQGKNTEVLKWLFNRRHFIPNVCVSYIITT